MSLMSEKQKLGEDLNSLPASSNLPDFSNSPSLSNVLKVLGFEPNPEEGNEYEWLYAYPSARPLLQAIATTFSADCVLTVDEAESYAEIHIRNPSLLHPSEARDIAQPLAETGFSPNPAFNSPQNARAALRKALQERLAGIQSSIAIIKELLVVKDSTTQHSQDLGERGYDIAADETSESLTEISDLLDEIEQAVKYPRTIASPTKSPSKAEVRDSTCDNTGEVGEYIQEERFENELIINSVEEFSQKLSVRPVNEVYDIELTTDDQLCELVDGYAELRARTVKTEIDIARKCAIAEAFLSVDYEQFDAEGYESISHLYKQLTSRAKNAEASIVDDVTKRARQWLWDCIRIEKARHILKQQQSYINELEKNLSALVEQRIRIMCVSAAQNREKQVASDLKLALDDLEVAANNIIVSGTSPNDLGVGFCRPKLSRVMQDEVVADKTSGTSTNKEDSVEIEHTLGSLEIAKGGSVYCACESSPHDCNFSNNHIDDKVSPREADKVQDSTAITVIEEMTSILTEFRTRIGCKNDWLELNPSSDLIGKIKELDDEISANSVVLESLIRSHSQIQNGKAAATNANREWIRQVNALR